MDHLLPAIARALAAAVVLGAIALAGLSPAACPAQAADAEISTGKAPSIEDSERSTAPAQANPEEGAAQAPLDPIQARIKYLHDRLRITPAQEPLWAHVAQAMRDNAAAVAPLIKERLQSAQKGSAVDNLSAYEKLGEAQLNGLKKFIVAFKTLYAGLSADQKKVADAVFRLGPLSMVGAIPGSAEELIAPEPYLYAPSYATLPAIPAGPPYLPYAFYPPYAYYPYYGPWLWGPWFGFGGPFFFVRGLHPHGFFPFGAIGGRGVLHGRAGVFHHR